MSSQTFGPSPAVLAGVAPYRAANIGRATEPRLAGSRGVSTHSGYGRSADANDPAELTIQIRSPRHNDFWSKPEYTSTLFLCLV